MNISRFFVGKLAIAALATAAIACSDGDAESSRAALLGFTATQIAEASLQDPPPKEFLDAAARVAKGGVSRERLNEARGFALAAGRGPALVADQNFAASRRSAAKALGTSLDPAKEADGVAAEESLSALLGAVQKLNGAAVSCEALGDPKADNCAYALIIIEVRRCEVPQAGADASVLPGPGTDAGVYADGGVLTYDGGASTDAGPVAVGAIECGPRDLTGAVEKTGSIDASETWSGKILVKGSLMVRAVTLTIAPGTEIFMDVDSSIAFGWNNTAATVIAEGTAAAPIRFCGTVAEPGFWSGLTVESNVTSNSVFRNVLVAEGGGDMAAALDLEADVLIDNVQVKNAGAIGVRAIDFKADSRALTIVGGAGVAAITTGEGALTRFPLGGTLTGNVDNTVHINFSEIMASTTVHNLGVPYVQDVDVRQRGGELTFEAGVEYRFVADTALAIGWNNSAAGIRANGTAAAPVRFRSATEPASAWAGITLESNVLSNSNLTYTEIQHAGSATAAALEIEAAVLVDNLTLSDNFGVMRVGAAGLKPESKNLTITRNAVRPLAVHTNAAVGLPLGGMLTGNAIDQIEIEGTRFERSGTINDLGIPYYIGGDALVIGGTTLTIAPGTDFVMGADSSLTVGWNNGSAALIANGTAEAPIRFTGGTATVGFWGGIVVEGGVLSTTRFNYVEISHAGSLGAALRLQLSLPAANITNCTFASSAGNGITKATANMIDYAPTNTFSMNELPDIGSF